MGMSEEESLCFSCGNAELILTPTGQISRNKYSFGVCVAKIDEPRLVGGRYSAMVRVTVQVERRDIHQGKSPQIWHGQPVIECQTYEPTR